MKLADLATGSDRIVWIVFAIFKEKAAKFVSGFNSLPKEEQAL